MNDFLTYVSSDVVLLVAYGIVVFCVSFTATSIFLHIRERNK